MGVRGNWCSCEGKPFAKFVDCPYHLVICGIKFDSDMVCAGVISVKPPVLVNLEESEMNQKCRRLVGEMSTVGRSGGSISNSGRI